MGRKMEHPTFPFVLAEIPFGTPAFDEALALRDRILRQPLGLQFTEEQIASEWDSLHLGLYHISGILLGCLTLKPVAPGIWKMRQVAIEATWQGRGLGKQLVEYAENVLIHRRAERIELHARDTAVVFYQNLGYEVYGKPFKEVGIPHRAMKKDLHYEKDRDPVN